MALTIRGQIPWKALLLIPAVLILALLPSWAAGRPIKELLGVYLYQASQFETITMNAPSVFALVPDSKRVFNLLYVPGIIFGAAVALLWFTLLCRSRRRFGRQLIAQAALVSMLLIPLFLPKMHDRYFFPADLLAIYVAFLEPSLFWMPMCVIGVSFLAYQPFLFERSFVSLPLLALVMLGLTAFLAFRTIGRMYALARGQVHSVDDPSIGNSGQVEGSAKPQ
jgi:Gpi18-like mannosyltransferase